MDVVIAVALLLVAAGLFFNKPIRIEFNHTHTHKIEQPPVPPSVQDDNEAKQKKLEEEKPKDMNNIINVLNDFMTGRVDEDGH